MRLSSIESGIQPPDRPDKRANKHKTMKVTVKVLKGDEGQIEVVEVATLNIIE